LASHTGFEPKADGRSLMLPVFSKLGSKFAAHSKLGLKVLAKLWPLVSQYKITDFVVYFSFGLNQI